MSGHDHGHEQEDYSVCITVAIFFILTIILLFCIAQ